MRHIPTLVQVWIMVSVVLVVLPAIFCALLLLNWRNGVEEQPSDAGRTGKFLLRSTVHTWSVLTDQGGRLRSASFSMRFVNGSFCLMAFVLIASYKCTLTSHLTVPKMKPMPSTFEELAARPDLQVITEDQSKMMEMMMTAESGSFRILGDTLRRSPENLFRTREESVRLSLMGNKVYPGVRSPTTSMDRLLRLMIGTRPQVALVGKNLMKQTNTLAGRCTLTMARKTTGLYRTYHWPMTKNGPHNEAVSSK